MKDLKLYFLLYLLAFFSLTTGSFDYRFRGEEPTRAVMAYEMQQFHSFSQPTYLGEDYYRKPPLFNWLVIGSSEIFGWGVYTGRIVSLTFTFLVSLIIVLFSYRYIFDDIKPALLSGLIFLGFIDVLFWYGFLAEIDMVLTFFVFSMIISLVLAFEKRSYLLFSLSGFLTGLSFLLKGFPALVFFTVTFFVLTVYEMLKKGSIYKVFAYFVVSLIFMVVPVVVWLVNLKNPEVYINTLWSESFGRVEKSKDIKQFFMHLVSYPLLNIKQTLLVSVFVLGVLVLRFKKIKNVHIPERLILLSVIVLINYMPYLISAGARGRYILPLFPIVAVMFSFIISKVSTEKIYRVFIGLLVFSFVVRLFVGIIYFPYETEKKGLYRKIAKQMVSSIKESGKIASNCIVHKGLIFYVDIFTKKTVLSERKAPDWRYFISCNERLSEGKLINVYDYKNEKIYLYERK